MIGTQVGSYRIEKKLGEGGMGTVYRGIEVNLERPVAIKVLNPDLARNPAVLERFTNEARTLANLMHPNVAILYAFFVENGNAMMVMEFIDGQDLQEIVNRNGPIPVHQALPWFQQALRGIGAAHHAGIVHRDIKPNNLMLNKEGVVKVLDFGVARVGGERRLTRAGAKVGTVFYMSPEQVKDAGVDARSDIYALGVTLYELLTAHVPFSSESDFTVMSDHVSTPPPLPTQFNPSIPKGVEKIILKCLEKDPADRFQSVEELTAALEWPVQWETYQPRFAYAQQFAPPRAIHAATTIEPAYNAPQQPMTPLPQPQPMPAQPFYPTYQPTPAPPPIEQPRSRNPLIFGGIGAVVVIAAALFYSQKKSDTTPAPTPTPTPQQQHPFGQPTPVPGQGRVNPPPQPVPTPQQQQPAQQDQMIAQKLDGVWNGQYVCGQGRTAMRLTIKVRSSLQDVIALFEFPARNQTGGYYMRGTFATGQNRLDLAFVSWKVQPPGFIPVNMAAIVNLDGGTMSGRMLNPSCSDFAARK